MNAVEDTTLIHLTRRELDVLRSALRRDEEAHKRNDFKTLELEAQVLRSKINDVLISQNLNHHV